MIEESVRVDPNLIFLGWLIISWGISTFVRSMTRAWLANRPARLERKAAVNAYMALPRRKP